MMSLNLILRKCTAGYKLHKSQEKINHQLYMERHKTLCKKRKRIGNPNTDSENIQSGHRERIWHRMLIMKKRKTTHDGRNGTS